MAADSAHAMVGGGGEGKGRGSDTDINARKRISSLGAVVIRETDTRFLAFS